jgi:hypothetical protein
MGLENTSGTERKTNEQLSIEHEFVEKEKEQAKTKN